MFSHIENDAESAEEILRGARRHYKGPIVVGEDLMYAKIKADFVISRLRYQTTGRQSS